MLVLGNGDGDGIAQTYFYGRANLFFLRRTISTDKPRALVGYEPRTELELSARTQMTSGFAKVEA